MSIFQSILEEAMEQLNDVRKDAKRYQQILEGLLSQAFFQLLENDVLVQCRKEDKQAVEVTKITNQTVLILCLFYYT